MNNQEKRRRFEKVASKRVQKTIDTLSLIKNCANRNNYEYTAEDIELMFKEIGNALRDAKKAFSNELQKKEKKGFCFNSAIQNE